MSVYLFESSTRLTSSRGSSIIIGRSFKPASVTHTVKPAPVANPVERAWVAAYDSVILSNQWHTNPAYINSSSRQLRGKCSGAPSLVLCSGGRCCVGMPKLDL